MLHERLSLQLESFAGKIRVLFLCSDNSVQSPMAEGLLKRLDSEHFEAMSAGIERGETHPLTLKVVGLYVNPPEHAVVLCVYENQIGPF